MTLSPNLYRFQTAPQIVAGPGSLGQLGAHLDLAGSFRSALVVAQRSMVRQGFADEVVRQLEQKEISCSIIQDVMPEPTAGHIRELCARLSEESFDLIVGIGGGSVLDVTKLISVLRTNDRQVEEMLGIDNVERPGIPAVLIPSTAGTGSEVTPNAIVTLPEEELKIGVVSRHLLPRLVVLDPCLTMELPQAHTAATGMDAFTHAIESYISVKANPISDMFALESIRLISRNIVQVYREGSDLAAREQMLLGSMYGGMALTGSGTAAVHALAYPLGGKFNIPHGVANSMLLPHVMEFNESAVRGRLKRVAVAMGLGGSLQNAEGVIQKIKEWTVALDIPQDLRVFGVEGRNVPALAQAALKVTRLMQNNPKPMAAGDVEAVYRKLLP
ncbi:iron-containing alcohol dehydrogenase [Cohnella sp. CFH 77786]|uniref:iron-containing alcohol dehydrogenase n=1 Tax=Cohnella sp. CFH 77786 TaxID=2662265 RepID=UPI001C60F13A|nr:iron-containing alcohol dehydrogenase [Cohnella sp. CFH 77786]MBW5447059.1 iron-containing alcohol dehydrogenase [Cohnella sp. CFH 77786]